MGGGQRVLDAVTTQIAHTIVIAASTGPVPRPTRPGTAPARGSSGTHLI